MIFRTEAQKKDQAWSWNRNDRAFFAAGACHILAHVFLQRPGNETFKPWLILPRAGYRGEHVFAARGTLVFDYHGYADRDCYLGHYFRKIRRFFPGWQGNVVELDEFMTPSFFEIRNYRRPDQYFQDPIPRAKAFIERLESHQNTRSGKKSGQALHGTGRTSLPLLPSGPGGVHAPAHAWHLADADSGPPAA